MDPFESLKADHRMVEQLFTEIEDAKGASRTPFIERLVTSLRGHMQVEEQVVYPLVAQHLEQEKVDEANTEHELARDGLEKLQALAPDEPGFGAALDMVKSGIEHHVKEEEEEMFPDLASKLGDDGAAVAQQMADLRVQLGMPTDLAAGRTKEELYAAAERAGIDGRAGMTKEELAAALEAKKAS